MVDIENGKDTKYKEKVETEEASQEYIELEKCPFCGRHATIVRHPGIWDNPSKESSLNNGRLHGLWYVGCSYNYFEGIDDLPMCQINPSALWYAKLSDAIVAWNKRVEEAIEIPAFEDFYKTIPTCGTSDEIHFRNGALEAYNKLKELMGAEEKSDA